MLILPKKRKVYDSRMQFNMATTTKVELKASGVSIKNIVRDDMAKYLSKFKSESTLAEKLSKNLGWVSPEFLNSDAAKAVIPKPEDYITVPFRMLSKAMVGANTWKATDFTDGDVLKKSTRMADAITLYKDHETEADEWVGVVNGTQWVQETESADGIFVPAGIDGLFAIDAVKCPDLARSLIMGSVYSDSVGVNFKWEPSHTYENEWEFYYAIGTIGKDGNMICRKVLEVTQYDEASLLHLGADPFAKAITPEGMEKVDKTRIYTFSLSDSTKKLLNLDDKDDSSLEAAGVTEETGMPNQLSIFSLNANLAALTLKKQNNSNNNTDNNKTEDMKNLLVLLAAVNTAVGLNLTLEEGKDLTDEQLTAAISGVEAHRLQFSSVLTAAKTATTVDGKAPDSIDLSALFNTHTLVSKVDYAKQIADSNAELEKYKALAEAGEKYSVAMREEVTRLYTLSLGGKEPAKAVLDVFNKADIATLEAFALQYGGESYNRFGGATCAECGSANVSFRKSQNNDTPNNPAKQDDNIVLDAAIPTMDDIFRKAQKLKDSKK